MPIYLLKEYVEYLTVPEQMLAKRQVKIGFTPDTISACSIFYTRENLTAEVDITSNTIQAGAKGFQREKCSIIHRYRKNNM